MPLGQAAPVTEIADGVLYILSATSMTGQLIALDGGQHLGWDFPDPEAPQYWNRKRARCQPTLSQRIPQRHPFQSEAHLYQRLGAGLSDWRAPARKRWNPAHSDQPGFGGSGVSNPIEDRLSNVLCYENVIVKVRELATAGHVNLVETLAERLADLCLSEPGVQSVKVR